MNSTLYLASLWVRSSPLSPFAFDENLDVLHVTGKRRRVRVATRQLEAICVIWIDGMTATLTVAALIAAVVGRLRISALWITFCAAGICRRDRILQSLKGPSVFCDSLCPPLTRLSLARLAKEFGAARDARNPDVLMNMCNVGGCCHWLGRLGLRRGCLLSLVGMLPHCFEPVSLCGVYRAKSQYCLARRSAYEAQRVAVTRAGMPA